VLGLAVGASGIVVAVLLLQSTPGPVSTASIDNSGGSSTTAAPSSIEGGRIPTPTQPNFPSPPPGAVVMAQEAGDYGLGVAFARASGGTLVRASVIGPDNPVTGLHVTLAVGTATGKAAAACGAGCYQTTFATMPSAGHLVVSLGARHYLFPLPSRTADASKIVSQAGDTWRALKTLVWHERLGSSSTQVLYTVYEAVAPDRLAYAIKGDSQSIIIGEERWDRSTPTSGWVETPQNPPLDIPVPFWVTHADANVLGTGTFHGRPVWHVTFFDPDTPGWFSAEIDRQNDRTLELDMIAAAHFMHHVYGPFNAPIKIVPPQSA
jgi:hypothetical protein